MSAGVNFKPTIFISRAGEDSDAAIQIADILAAAGFSTFVQDNNFGHASFMDRMAEGFRHVDAGGCLIALLSKHYQSKAHCLKEARYPLIDDAANSRERLIVLRLDDCRPADLLKDIRYDDIGQYLDRRAELSDVVIGAVNRSLRMPTIASEKATLEPKIEQMLLFLENEDHADFGKGWSATLCIFSALAAIMIAFDYGLHAWNWLFDTTYFAIFPTGEVVTMWMLLAGIMCFAVFWQIQQLARTIENARLSISQLRTLRSVAMARTWKDQWLVEAAISKATRRITSSL